MNTYQIEAFITLGNVLNYTKASSLLHTTQPNLSKMIVTLEQEVGVQLINRNKREVKLTPAGMSFHADMKAMMNQYQLATAKVKEIDAGIKGVLDIGFLGTALIGKLSKIVNSFRAENPDILLNLYDFTYSRLTEALDNGDMDIVLIPDRELERLPGIDKILMFEDDMCLVVSSEHPFSEMKNIDLKQAQTEPFVMMDKKISIRDYELVTKICSEEGFKPNIVYESNTLNNLIMMVECGVGVAVLASHMRNFSTDKVSFIPIKGYERFFRMSCAWRPNSNPCITHFLDTLAATKMAELQ